MKIPYWVLETEAALSISPPAFKALVYLLKRFNGINNGRIAFGARSGCFLREPGNKVLVDRPFGLAPSTIGDALYELEKAGFIRCTRESSFDQKRLVREWRITWLNCGNELPTKEFATATGNFRRPKAPRKQKPDRVRGG